MPRTAELAIQILFDLWEERKKAGCLWMGRGCDLYRDSAHTEKDLGHTQYLL